MSKICKMFPRFCLFDKNSEKLLSRGNKICVTWNRGKIEGWFFTIPQLGDEKVDPAGMFPKLDQAHVEKFMGNKSYKTVGLRLKDLTALCIDILSIL